MILRNINILKCPLCNSDCFSNKKEVSSIACSNIHCLQHDGFLTQNSIPVLIDFSSCDTVCNPGFYSKNIVYVNRDRPFFHSFYQRIVYGNQKQTQLRCSNFINLVGKVPDLKGKASVLIIGSGTVGRGCESLYNSNIEITGVDIYASPTTDYICDAHNLPFKDGSFEGVWIQAVLEHVVLPEVVVSEIYRVLKVGGIVYSETPFLQQVHEGAYDFTRYTVLGHRYLFRQFKAIEFGFDKGAGTVLAWSFRYWIKGLSRSQFLSSLLTVPVTFILRLIDPVVSLKVSWDSCSGVFFMGTKESGYRLSAKDLISEYKGDF